MTLPRADKNLGQHFLKDQSVIKKITNDFKDECDAILEIGPGPGILTKFLQEHGKPFYVIEKDERFPSLLKEILPPENIFLCDALEFSYEEFFQKNNFKNIWLVSNLPYNVSAPLFMKFLELQKVQRLTLMFQKEVGEKTYEKASEKNQMNSLLALSLTYFDSSLLCKVLPGAFSPPPKVDSVVVSYKRKESPIVPYEKFKDFENFLKFIFSQKRKQLKGILKQKFSQEKIDSLFDELGLSTTIRAEALSLKEIHSLFYGL